MVRRQKSIKQLRKEIAQQRRRIEKQQLTSKIISERQKLSRELFLLRNRKLIEAGKKARRLSGRLGRGILRTGKRIAPVIKKQAKLIRQQQLRDDAIARKLAKSKIQPTKIRRRVKVKKRPIKKKRSRQVLDRGDLIEGGVGLLGDLAF